MKLFFRFLFGVLIVGISFSSLAQSSSFMNRGSCAPNPTLDTGMIALFQADKIVIASVGKLPGEKSMKKDKRSSPNYALFEKAVQQDTLRTEYLYEMKVLNLTQRNRLKEIMLAYRGGEATNRIMRCHRPHHAIYFLDAQDHIIAWMEICFQCDGAYFRSATEMNVTDRCVDIYKPLNIFFSRAGIEYQTIPLYIIEDRF